MALVVVAVFAQKKFFGCFSGDLRHSGFKMVEKVSTAGGLRRSERGHASSVIVQDEDALLILTQEDKDTRLQQLATPG